MDPVSLHINTGPTQSATQKRAMLNGNNVGAVPKPTPINPKGGNFWLPVPLAMKP
jgi:hypothetical protein